MMKRTLFISGLLLICYSISLYAGEILITSSPDKVLDADAVKNIFLGKKKSWSDGSKITLAVLKSGDVHETFCTNIVKKNAGQFSTYWKQQVFTGQAVMPKSFDSEDALASFVASTSGAIGYVSEEKTGDLPSGVSIVEIK